jgi:hypothetical protein
MEKTFAIRVWKDFGSIIPNVFLVLKTAKAVSTILIVSLACQSFMV